MYRTICVIPARSGSSVKNKNIREVGGQPLIAYSILDAIQCKKIENTYVSTDSQEIADIARQYGAEVPFLRPKEYAQSNSPDIEWAQHFLDWFKKEYNYYPVYLVQLRPTTPFRDISVIEQGIITMEENPDATSVISVEEMVESPYKTFELNGKFLKPLLGGNWQLMPRQKCPKVYDANGYVDVLTVKTLLEGNLHGNKKMAFITPRAIEIDSEDDLKIAQWYLEHNT
jgi:CMP-N,N'-diacetyllegionaminic acid synthase